MPPIEDKLRGVRVTTGARLHLGFLDLAGDLGRRFGSIGLAINGFATRVEMRRAARLATQGVERARAVQIVRRLAEAHRVDGHVEVEIETAIPAHAGLGSGTQLALALGLAFRTLHGLAPDPRADADILMRGARSGLGLGLFSNGGFMIDAGRGQSEAAAPIVSHLAFPADWRVVLLIDESAQGAHGPAEREAFAALPPFPPDAAAWICRHALMQVLPGVAEADFPAFAQGLSEIQRRLGDHFAPAQGGGRYASARVGAAVAALERRGARGVGQSSWGPTAFVFAADPDAAATLALRAEEEAQGALRIEVHAARASGAECVILS